MLGIHQQRLNWGPDGEERLTDWMNTHARMAWVENETPWDLEDEMLAHAVLPLNIMGRADPFSMELKAKPSAMSQAAFVADTGV